MSRRTFSPDLKRRIVEEHLLGGKPVSVVCREHCVGETAMRRWLALYRAEEGAATSEQAALARQLRQAQEEIAGLEATLGRTTAELDFMRQAFKRAGVPFPSVRRQ